MHDDEIIAVKTQLAAERGDRPLKSGAPRKRVRYAPETTRRAVELYRLSAQTPAAFAQRLGVSLAALERWVQDDKVGSAFIPIYEAAAPAVPDVTAAQPATEALAAPERLGVAPLLRPPMAAFMVRETLVSLPAGLDVSRLREIVMALRAGDPC
jgi:transposase-like protein